MRKEKIVLVEKIIGKIGEIEHKSIEYVSVEWHECHKRIVKKTLKSGEDLGIRRTTQDAQIGFFDGDVLAVIDGTALVVEIAPTEALVINTNADMIAKVCYEIGNRHAPFFKGENPYQFYSPYEMPVKVMLERLGVEVKVDKVKFTLENAISSSNGGHSHSHDDGGYDGKNGKVEGSFYKKEHLHEHTHEHSHSHENGHSHDGGKTFHTH